MPGVAIFCTFFHRESKKKLEKLQGEDGENAGPREFFLPLRSDQFSVQTAEFCLALDLQTWLLLTPKQGQCPRFEAGCGGWHPGPEIPNREEENKSPMFHLIVRLKKGFTWNLMNFSSSHPTPFLHWTFAS